MKPGFGIFLPLILVAACVTVAGYLFTRPAPWQVATPAPQLAEVPKVPLQIKAPLQVYAPAAKKKLRLPPAVQQDPNKSVLAATEIKPDTHRQTVVTVVDAATGQTETIIRREPLPWIASDHSGEIRIDYGYKHGQAITRLSVQQNLLQLKALRAGVNATLDSDGDLFVGVGVGWWW